MGLLVNLFTNRLELDNIFQAFDYITYPDLVQVNCYTKYLKNSLTTH